MSAGPGWRTSAPQRLYGVILCGFCLFLLYNPSRRHAVHLSKTRAASGRNGRHPASTHPNESGRSVIPPETLRPILPSRL